VEYALVEFRGAADRSWGEILDLAPDAKGSMMQSHIGNRVIAGDAMIDVLAIQGDDYHAAMLAAESEISITLCYCSVYEECWTVDRSNRTMDVEACTIEANRRFGE